MDIKIEIRQKWYTLPACMIGVLLIRCGANDDRVAEFLARHCFKLGLK